MAEFESFRGYDRFSSTVMRKTRYCFGPKCLEFVNQVIESSASRKRTIVEGETFWRAQSGGDDKVTIEDGIELTLLGCSPFSAERMAPLTHCATEGRVNSKGIPCLYCATERETAMAEMRPWTGSLISVAQLQVVRDLDVVDCTLDSDWLYNPSWIENEPDQQSREKHIWWNINEAFSRPVDRNSDNVAGYAPTQILSEAFRKAGYAGVRYRSHLGRGVNVAFFDLSVARFNPSELHKVDRVDYAFSGPVVY